MKQIQHLAAAIGGLCAFGFLIFVVWFLVSDLRYVGFGSKTEATIVFVSHEFAGFSEDEYRGTEPQFLHRYSYSFTVDGIAYSGQKTTLNNAPQVGESMPIQYLHANPEKHRVLTPGTQVFRGIFYTAFSLVFVGLLLPGTRR